MSRILPYPLHMAIRCRCRAFKRLQGPLAVSVGLDFNYFQSPCGLDDEFPMYFATVGAYIMTMFDAELLSG